MYAFCQWIKLKIKSYCAADEEHVIGDRPGKRQTAIVYRCTFIWSFSVLFLSNVV